MKKINLIVVTLFTVTALAAQNANTEKTGSTYLMNTGFRETIPVRDMPLQTAAEAEAAALHHMALEERREGKRPHFDNFKKKEEIADPIQQTTQGTRTLTAPIVNVDGQLTGGGCPPDPDGAVGATQYVQAVNSSYQVFSKTGTALTGVIDLKTLFPNIPGDDGDPIVLYDKFADRWMITEFQVSTAPCGFSVAISKTNDATGAFYVYNFSNVFWTTSNYPDYVKFSIWSDGYYVTGQFSPEKVVVLDRTRMLAGKSSAGMILASVPSTPYYFGANNSLYTSAKTLDCDASALPPYGSPEYMVFFENIASGGYSDMIKFYKCVHDTTAHTLTVTRADSVAPTTFSAYFTGGTEREISQPGSANSLDALDGTFNFRVPFMAFTGYNSIVLCNSVNTGSLVSGIRWYELRQSGAGMPWSIYQQGTYAPADGASRWNGSIGMDQDGDIAMEYNVSSSTIYPSIRYTGRMAGDALGTMTGTETVAVAGTTPAVSCVNRWGDYSEMTLDPADNVTFWNTNEYCKGGQQASRIFSFRLTTTAAGISNPIDLTEFKVYQVSNNIQVVANKLPSDEQVQVDLFDIVGKQISSQLVKPVANAIQTNIPVNGLPTATYFVRIGNLNYQRVFKVHVGN
ncbi:MAG: T9SS type A sorting domain-containing protein [Bacteroidia bacterium]